MIDFNYVQSQPGECGLACLALCLSKLGHRVSLHELRNRHPSSQRGTNFAELIRIAKQFDVTCRPLKCEIPELSYVSLPMILHWGMNHYVVLERINRRGYHIFDPAGHAYVLDKQRFGRKFTGVALEITRAPGFKRRTSRSDLSVWEAVNLRAAWRPLSTAIAFTLILQVFVLATPYFIQLAVDEAALHGNQSLLITLAVGFALLVAFNAAAEGLRGQATQQVSAVISWDLTTRLFHHMIRLPQTWFDRRRLADTITRFESVAPIRQLVTNTFIISILDGVLSLLLVVMLFLYAWQLALVVTGAQLVALLIRVASVPHSLRLGISLLRADIAEKGNRIETVRGIQALKLAGAEGQRQSQWANHFADVVRYTQKSSNLTTWVAALRGLVTGLSLVFVVYFGTKYVLAGTFSIGALYAFLAYRSQLESRVGMLVEQAIMWRLTELHSGRIAELALEPREALVSSANGDFKIEREIAVKGMAFRYSPRDPMILSGISAAFRVGQLTVIEGPSGCGKSTLLKLITGLYRPSIGDVYYDGVPLASIGVSRLRSRLAAVLQDDHMFSGTIIENTSWFADEADINLAWQCLDIVGIEPEVRSLPMQLNTDVGDLGANFSSGQRQRLILARALYRKPDILVLDEATAHLDAGGEEALLLRLKTLGKTIIVVSHRPSVKALADRIVRVGGASRKTASLTTQKGQSYFRPSARETF